MTYNLILVKRYDANEGYVFDWLEPRYTEDESGNQIQDHLYAKTLFLSETDDIENYVEIKNPNLIV